MPVSVVAKSRADMAATVMAQLEAAAARAMEQAHADRYRAAAAIQRQALEALNRRNA
jgi:hypothetical protein